jgi:hypothetical protein
VACSRQTPEGDGDLLLGPELDTRTDETLSLEQPVRNVWTAPTTRPTEQKRTTERRSLSVPARLTWKDQHGTTRFASVVTRNISEFGVYVECHSPVSIPLFRLVQFQIERDLRDADGLPMSLRHGRALSAVYRVNPPAPSGVPQGLALRLMIDPKRHVAAPEVRLARATA